MSLVTVTELLKKAEEGNYAVGAFNVNNMEIIQALVESATEESSPLILQASQGAIKYAGIDYIVGLVETAAKQTDIPIALHLDHGTSFDQNMLCIRKGFSSVMYDGSEEPLEENIKKTAEVVRIAHAVGVSVEGELGRIAGTEDNINVEEEDAFLTDPDEAKTFVKETGVDALAVAIGTAHGPYKGKEPKLDFERLEKIKNLTNTPIVLHGASGVPDESIKKAIDLGVRKINIDTNIRQAFTKGVRELLGEKPDEYDPRKILRPAKEEMKEVIKEKIRLFGCAGKA
ncbi:class II fructose-1,6-bisphosphate aldolase [Natranaerofaba carboxydovora]|uniref:class II fructose-1,6-bisphosphate aldolase n=1 Tax=Natranaerofaba carboxydovora TaxID=2742683 RepID=UPI001F13FDCB|nr:class II fructose-1,6-bisphosphate aldolase [Natranaerofaba carboxydovora]UMZ75134.1 Fructose-bisphosphate aldolase [Natranaerofaba carboxydovora]